MKRVLVLCLAGVALDGCGSSPSAPTTAPTPAPTPTPTPTATFALVEYFGPGAVSLLSTTPAAGTTIHCTPSTRPGHAFECPSLSMAFSATAPADLKCLEVDLCTDTFCPLGTIDSTTCVVGDAPNQCLGDSLARSVGSFYILDRGPSICALPFTTRAMRLDATNFQAIYTGGFTFVSP